MKYEGISRRLGKARLGKRRVLLGLSGLFVFAWVLFVISYYTLFREVPHLPTDLGRIVIIVLALFGAVNVMLLSLFFLIIIVWAKGSDGETK